MILYNVTTKIDPSIKEDWLEWMIQHHIPAVLNTGFFSEYKLSRLLINEEDGFTYSIQYSCKSMADLQEYQKNHAGPLRQEYKERYEGKYVIFRSLMEVVSSKSYS